MRTGMVLVPFLCNVEARRAVLFQAPFPLSFESRAFRGTVPGTCRCQSRSILLAAAFALSILLVYCSF